VTPNAERLAEQKIAYKCELVHTVEHAPIARYRALSRIVGAKSKEGTMKVGVVAAGLAFFMTFPQQVFAWGDEGHMTVAQIAEHFLRPSVKTQITSMLAADTDPLTKHDFASEATWADKFRDANERRSHYEGTENWHFTDLEISHPDLETACFGRPSLPRGVVASNGQAKACAVDKVKQFAAELKASGTDAE
jgi:S1/P1 Nuclease